MNNKLVKFLNTISICLLTFGIFLVSGLATLNAASTNIYYITTCVGENETSIGINYHCNTKGSMVIYSTSPSFSGAKTVRAESREWSSDIINDDKRTGFASRYVCTVNLEDLEPDTQYYYKVEAGDETSDVYTFTTHDPESNTATVLFATDIHASTSMPNTAPTVDSIWKKINQKFGNLNLVVTTGDSVDRGGYESEWQSFYNGMSSLKEVILASIPGNHEYYHSKDGSYVSPYFFNQFYNNPKNGPESRMNSSFYFKYGNALFVMIDTINREYVEEQKAWFEEVMKNNTAKWIIVGTHAGGITAGIYDHDADWIKKEWVPLWEQYQVDLCLSGHEHIYIRKDLTYQDEKNEDLGVSYLVGAAAGHKQYQVVDGTGLVVKPTNFCANVISIRGGSLTITLYDKNGEETNYSLQLKPKRDADSIVELSDQEILDSIKIEQDKENNTAKLTWSPELYGNVHDIIISRVLYGNSVDFRTVVSTTAMTYYNLNPIYSDMPYEIKLKINKKDGSSLEKTFNLIPTATYKLNLVLNDGVLENSDQWTSYTSSQETTLPTPTKENHKFLGWYKDQEFSGDPITVISDTTYDNLTLYAKWELITSGSPDNNQNQPGDSKKCGSKCALVVELLSASSLLYLIFKKRK